MFVLSDNVGWGDFSCYGGGTATERIDKLPSEGIRFTNYIAKYPNIKTGEEFTGYKAEPG